MDTAVALGLAALVMGGGGLGGWWLSRAQARKATSEAAKTDIDATIAEAKLQPEVDSIAVTVLNSTVTTLSGENERMGRRLATLDATMEQQARTIAEQAVTIDKQADTIADYRQQVARLTDRVRELQDALELVRRQLEELQHNHGGSDV